MSTLNVTPAEHRDIFERFDESTYTPPHMRKQTSDLVAKNKAWEAREAKRERAVEAARTMAAKLRSTQTMLEGPDAFALLMDQMLKARKHSAHCAANGRYQESDVWGRYAERLAGVVGSYREFRGGRGRMTLNQLAGQIACVNAPLAQDHDNYLRDWNPKVKDPRYQGISVRGCGGGSGPQYTPRTSMRHASVREANAKANKGKVKVEYQGHFFYDDAPTYYDDSVYDYSDNEESEY
jgi:hypothetical protein